MNIYDIIRLSELLAEMGSIRRATKLPSGEYETDSHHSFSLALVAYEVCVQEQLEVDTDRVVLYALAHDLLEIITGDVDTLMASSEELAAKHEREMNALQQFDELFAAYPSLKKAFDEYERLDTAEAATVYVLDKACTTWTHHHDKADYARQKGITTAEHAEAWAQRKLATFMTRLKAEPPKRILEIYEESFEAMKELYDA